MIGVLGDTRRLDEMVHHDRAAADEFLSDEESRRQVVQLRAGNVARHVEADEHRRSSAAWPPQDALARPSLICNNYPVCFQNPTDRENLQKDRR
jgi:hypothetical protein